MEQMSLPYAISLFNTECVNCFGKKPVHVEKLIIAVSAEFGESQCKTFSKLAESSIITDFLAFTGFLTRLN